MSGRISGLKAYVQATMRQQAIPPEMEQSLAKEFVHLHILSSLSAAGVLDRVVFQGGTALRLCHGGDRYSEDLDFVCGTRGDYVADVDFQEIVEKGMKAAAHALESRFGLVPEAIAVKSPQDPAGIAGDEVHVAAWQLVVPLEPTPRSPKSRIKVEFANVPSYDHAPRPIRSSIRLTGLPTTILRAETPREILADKAVALTARAALKHRDVWDVWFLTEDLKAKLDLDLVTRKFADYGVATVAERVEARIAELATPEAEAGFLSEMARFLPAQQVAQMNRFGMHRAMLGASADLLRQVAPALATTPR